MAGTKRDLGNADIGRETWEAMEDRDGTWSVWRRGRMQSQSHPDVDDAMSYIRGRARAGAEVIQEDHQGRSEVVGLDD